jgi:hypothetical protein
MTTMGLCHKRRKVKIYISFESSQYALTIYLRNSIQFSSGPPKGSEYEASATEAQKDQGATQVTNKQTNNTQ